MIKNFELISFTAVVGDDVYLRSNNDGGTTLQVTNEDGTVRNISQATFAGDCGGQPLEIEVVDAASGLLRAKLTNARTTSLGAGTHDYYLKITTVDSEVFTLLKGAIKLE